MSGSSMSDELRKREEMRIAERNRINGLLDEQKKKIESLRERAKHPVQSPQQQQQFIADLALADVVMLVAAMPPDAAFGVSAHLFARFRQINGDFIPADMAEPRREFDRFQRFAQAALDIAVNPAKAIPTPTQFLPIVPWYAEMTAKGLPGNPWSIVLFEEFLLKALSGQMGDILPAAVQETIMSAAHATTRERAAEIFALFANFPA